MTTRPPIKTVPLLALVLGCAISASALAEKVKAPSLPPGSSMVKIKPGMSQPEEKRSERAHHHKFHHRKDMTRDDTVHGDPSHAHNHGHSNGKPAPAPAVAPAKKSK